ncbi:MAG: mannose-1-phosphate guanylyltransferase, partial [Thermoanaerobaculia bacterium]
MRGSRSVLILAGGAGTRLWPLSTDARPKQFLRIFDGESLLQKAGKRLARQTSPDLMFVSTNERYAPLVREQLPALPPDNILVEPARRNTAPAIAACCATIHARHPDATVGIFPSDHWIGDERAFEATVDRAFSFAETSDHLVTIGLEPTEPNTGYGYLELAAAIEEPVFRLARFVEKPDKKRAEEFIAAGNFLWNGGMFVWKLDTFVEALRGTAPEIAALAARFAAEDDAAKARAIFESMPSISIDYALMEKARKVATVRADFGWSDVGSWSAAARFMSPSTVSVHQSGTANVFAHSETGRPLVVVGAKDLFVIDSPDG